MYAFSPGRKSILRVAGNWQVKGGGRKTQQTCRGRKGGGVGALRSQRESKGKVEWRRTVDWRAKAMRALWERGNTFGRVAKGGQCGRNVCTLR